MAKLDSKIYKIFLILILAVSFLNTANAYRFEEYSVYYSIDKNNVFSETINIKIYNNDSKEIKDIRYNIPQQTSNLIINSSNGVDSYSITSDESTGITEIFVRFEKPITPGNTGTLSLSFSGRINDINDKRQVYIIVPALDSKFKLTVELPEGATIVSPVKDVLSISPRDYTISTDGKSIFILWEKQMFSSERYFEATINYMLTAVPPEPEKVDNENLYRAIILVLAVLLTSLIFFVYRNYNKLKMIHELQNEINGLNRGLEISGLNLQNKDREIRRLEELNNHLTKELEHFKNTFEDQDSKINSLKEQLSLFERQKETYENLKSEYSKLQNEVSELTNYKKLSNELKKKIDELMEILGEKEEYISELVDRIGNYESQKNETLMNILIDEERELIELIKEHGSISQKEIVDITGLTKPKVSRMISDLEQRGIVKKVKIGRINKIALSKELGNDN
ncbi:conserved hypothetical protein [Methanococcus vannielii SB]|uniref:DUF7343 domain-containing protein n=1 Tax=Methanococcus vannielii (strain ATCC 35089 / DSM 1224 / JCM 13029 / OCM 148 / SB) TaxID=406327 RepID=A6US14_METVS|nr:winged helix-turn-helix transcriptional regulator [Methanococcus vannielii]ABR55286.1 conserved hypothetical protein [Methanococcus vannielii SB]